MALEEDIRTLRKIPGVTKVGYGLKETQGKVIPQMVYRVYVKQKKTQLQLSPQELIPETISNIPTDVLVDDVNTAQDASTTSIDAGDQVSRYVPGERSQSGTAGLFVTKNSNRYLLTNHHVLRDNFRFLDEHTLNIYSPERKVCMGIECNSPVARVLPQQGVYQNVSDSGNLYYVDATLATINDGVEVSNEAPDIGLYNQGLRNLSPLALTPAPGIESGTGPLINVQKRGATTGVTSGQVVEYWHTQVIESVDVPVWQLRIKPVVGEDQEYEQEVEIILPEHQTREDIVNFFSGHSVSCTDLGDGTTGRRFRLSGHTFGRAGDSGSVIVDGDRKIVGLLTSTRAMTVRVFEGEVVQHAKIYSGDAFACYITPVFNELGLSLTGSVISSGSSSAGAAIAIPSPAMSAKPIPAIPILDKPQSPASAPSYNASSTVFHFTEVEKALLKTSAGKLLNNLATRFLKQIVYLVHHRRRVTVMYYRRKGPAFANLILKAMQDPAVRIPANIEGISLQNTLRGLRDVLMMEGSSDLKAAIEQHGDWIISLSENINSVEQLLERLEDFGEALAIVE